MFLFGQLYSLSSSLKLAHMFGSGPLQGVAPIRNLLAVHSVHHPCCWDFSFGAWQTPESGPPDVSVSPPGAAFVHQLGDLEILKAFAPAFSVFCPVPNWNFVPVSPTYSFTLFVYKCAGQTG